MIEVLLWAFGGVTGFVLLALLMYLAIPFRRPFPTESDYSHHHSPWWQLNYAHKYLWPRTLHAFAARVVGVEGIELR